MKPLFNEVSMPETGRLTTHVLDAALGRPAAGMTIDLYRIEGEARTLVKTVVTNAVGRVDAPVLDGDAIARGTYELLFHAGAYLKAAGTALTDPPFLDLIPLRFGIADPSAHYHVPLLLSPYSYSTYRGS
jgi:5-hydroxyisourate hydrolase